MSTDHKIPAAIERLIIDNHGGAEKSKEDANKEKLNEDLNFWEKDDDSLDDFLFDAIADVILCLEEDDLAELPKPYCVLAAVMEFERHMQYDGWSAISNEGSDQMEIIIDGYRVLGLHTTALALRTASNECQANSEKSSNERSSIVEAAYLSSITPKASFDESYETRIEVIRKYARSIKNI